MQEQFEDKMSIPDDDVIGWMQTLREEGLNDQEIDTFLKNLNKEYWERTLDPKIKKSIEDRVLVELKSYEKQLGRRLTEDEKKNFIEGFYGQMRKLLKK